MYVLTSLASDCVKIGRTVFPPNKRLREVNTSSPYAELGPWSVLTWRSVKDQKRVERDLHYRFRSDLASDIPGQRELFRISPYEASRALDELDEEELIGKPKVDRMFHDQLFTSYLDDLFEVSGLQHELDTQGSWTFVLFPSSADGRFFTLNIGPHEVAFSSLPRPGRPQMNMLCLDRLVLDFKKTRKWMRQHQALFYDDLYRSALPHGISVHVTGGFELMGEFIRLGGVRRAIIAYWHERLQILRDSGSTSLFARHHDYNAVTALVSRLTAHSTG